MFDFDEAKSFKVIIAGGRDFTNYRLLKEKVDKIISEKRKTHNIIIVSGTARGADSLGEMYAQQNSFFVIPFPPQWDEYGKKAGYIRNVEMAEYADALIAFWDGESKGTKHMIDIATERNLQIRVVRY